MSTDSQNKIYYDVNIPYRAEEKDIKYRNYSKAETEIRMNGPLFSDPTNYDLTISKFKIDTECLPVYIPEMQQPQLDSDTDHNVETFARGEVKSNSWVMIYFPTLLNTTKPTTQRCDKGTTGWGKCEGKDWNDKNWKLYNYRYANNEDNNNGHIYSYLKKQITFTPNTLWMDMNYESFKKRNDLPTTSKSLDGKAQVFAENTNPAYFQYDFQSVLDRINVCMERLLQQVYTLNGTHPSNFIAIEDTVRAIYFQLSDGIINLYVDPLLIREGIMFKFSSDLYKYIGNGFKCRFLQRGDIPGDSHDADGSFIIEYNPFVCRHKKTNIAGDISDYPSISDVDSYWRSDVGFFRDDAGKKGIEAYCLSIADYSTNISTKYGADDIKRTYYVYKQQYSTLANWNVCKALLICSNTLPIKSEFYPTTKKNMFLTHYKEDWYKKVMTQLYNESVNDEDNGIFDKASMKILDVYYPLSSTGGDMRSCVIYDNANIESGNKIDLIGGMDIENFDIKVKWVDIYGNVYDLYLAPGCSVNLRLCFTRKKILKEDIVSAFKRVNDNLEIIANTKTEPEDDSHTFEIKKEPRRKRNKVELPGYLENGLIVKP